MSSTVDKKVAFLTPIHLPHFRFAKQLWESWKSYDLHEQSDLWFVLTDESEEEQFNPGEGIFKLVLPEHMRVFENNGIINIKKFYGLFEIKEKYEYVIVLDCEALFVKQVDLYDVCNSFWKKKTLYGNQTPVEGKRRTEGIKSSCRNWFANVLDAGPIENEDLYLWFNQPCIYKCSTLGDFFDKIDYANNSTRFMWADFDHYIYMYYLICYQRFKIEDMEILSNYGVCEAGIDYLHFKSNKYESLDIYMCSFATLKIFDNPKLFIICHLDRDNVWMQRVTNLKLDHLICQVDALNQQCSGLNQQLSESKQYCTTQITGLRQAYDARIEELRQAYDARIDELCQAYNARIDELYQLNSTLDGAIKVLQNDDRKRFWARIKQKLKSWLS